MSNKLHYLRICPECHHENHEHKHHCQHCGLFIGMEPAILIKSNIVLSEVINEINNQAILDSKPIIDWEELNPTKDAAVAPETDYAAPAAPPAQIELECLGYPNMISVPSGSIIGQQNSQNGPDVFIPTEITEARYLHRRHCRIDKENGRWWITALDQKAFGRDFTNPTRVNDIPLAPGERKELHEGDLLRLSGLRLRVNSIK